MNAASIIKHLSRDPVFKPIVKKIPFPKITFNEDLYSSLLEAIISQQLSIAAAKTIFSRFLALYNHKIPDFKTLINTNPEILRTAGISAQKAGYLKNIAQFGISHSLHYHDLKNMEDEELIAYLTQIKGVGRWTAEMILMFNLQRLDVLPLDDLGIQNTFKKIYGINTQGKALKESIAHHAERWSPYRSIACMYMWRWKDQNGA